MSTRRDFVKGSKLYRSAYVHDDHVSVMKAVRAQRHAMWAVSYDAVAPILDIYSDFNPTLYSLNYSAGAVGTGSEVIYVSDLLSLPAELGLATRAA